MAPDYIALAVVTVLGLSGGLYLLAQAEDCRARHHR